MFTQQKKDQILDEQLREEYQQECAWYYRELVKILNDSRQGAGYLSLRDIADAIKQTLGEDADIKALIKELSTD